MLSFQYIDLLHLFNSRVVWLSRGCNTGGSSLRRLKELTIDEANQTKRLPTDFDNALTAELRDSSRRWPSER